MSEYQGRLRAAPNDLPQPAYEVQQGLEEQSGYRDDMSFDERVVVGPVNLEDTDGVIMDWKPDRLRALLKERGLTQKQAAAGIGVAVSTLEFWLADTNRPDYRSLLKLCRYFDVEAVVFYERRTSAATLSAGIAAWSERNGRQ
jgi:DNA-binding XRE family transcriptional regulator